MFTSYMEVINHDTVERMANSASDPCYWVQDNPMASDPIHTAPLEIY